MISLGMIVRDEARTIEACLNSVAPFVDEIVIGFAGQSKDNTKQILTDWGKDYNVKFMDIEWTDNFSEARNKVLEVCTGDYFLWLDGDDVLVGGEKLQGYVARYPDVNAFYMGYDYARDEFGENFCFLIRERLVKRDAGWGWIGAIHEVLAAKEEVIGLNVPDIHVVHHKPADKHAANRNLDILYTQLEESEPNPDPRILAYLGSENAGRGNLTEAITHWQRFIKLSGWDEEKYQTQVKISNTYRQLGRLDKALQTAYHAIEMKPNWPDAYISLARTYCSEPLERYDIALEWLKVAAAKPIPQTMLIVNPQEYSYELSVLISVCYTHLEDWELALENYVQSYKVKQDPLIGQQIELLKKEMEGQSVLKAVNKLREYLGRHDEWLKVRQLLDVIPHDLTHLPSVAAIRERTMQQTAHIDNPQVMVDFYRSNPHWTSMNEDTIKAADWLQYPRMKFALDIAEKVNAKIIVDWGSSDGFIALPLARETKSKVHGFDLDPRCVDLANQRADEWGVEAVFDVADVDSYEWIGDKADLAIFFEVIEHVIDPAKTLETLERSAKHIAITTPFLAWEGGNIPAWDKIEPKGHLRIFDLDDIERLLKPRGRLNNLYRQAWGNSGWIFADYTPGAVAKGPRVTIGAQMGAETWGPQKLQAEGLGGSETAVIKLAQELAASDHRVTVFSPVDSAGYYDGVCYRDGSKFTPEVRSDLYISWRLPEAADWNINTERLVLWMHDTDAGDRLTSERAARFDNIVVLTEWHKQFFLSKYPFVDASKLVIIGNGIDLERFSKPVVRNSKKVVYASSPDRGLDIILEHIWPKILAKVPDAQLHIYYGWQNFDSAARLPGYDHLVRFKQKIQTLFLDSKNVVQHGRIPQGQLAREFQEATVWLYPTYFTETYCITAIEAQLAGAIPVTNHSGALKETVKSGVIIEGDVFDPNTQGKYADAVVSILKKTDREELHDLVKKNAPAITWGSVASSFAKLVKNG